MPHEATSHDGTFENVAPYVVVAGTLYDWRMARASVLAVVFLAVVFTVILAVVTV